MKNILLALSFIAIAFTNNLNATHVAGGDIQYRYIGDSTGIPYHYQIITRLYRDASAGTATLGTSITISICSNCYPSQSVNLMLYAGGPGQIAPTLFDCVTPGSTGTIPIEYYFYSGTVVLPGSCSNFTFSYNLCCRNSAIQNIEAPENLSFYIQARLNNFFGQNSSPQLLNLPMRTFCVNNTFKWPQTVFEADGDSLHFSLTFIKSGQSSCQFDSAVYDTGFTSSQPISTNPPNSLTINNKTGLIRFTPAVSEIVVLSLEVNEYRYDSLYGLWLFVGSSSWDAQVSITSQCSPTAQMGVVLDSAITGPSPPTPTIAFVCYDSIVQLNFQNPINCATIAPDGSNYRLLSPDNQPIPIIAATSTCDNLNSTNQIAFIFNQPLSQNGQYKLYSKVGNYGTTLGTTCGFFQSEFDTIILNVIGCSGISVDEFEIAKSEIYFPNAFTPNFDGVNDYFVIEIPEDARGNFLLEVFNRWGQPVHRTTDTQKLTWDGTQQGKDAASGVYYYTLKHIPTGHSWQGHITLLR